MKRNYFIVGTMLALLVMLLYVNMACAAGFDDWLKEKYDKYKKDYEKSQQQPGADPSKLLPPKTYDQWIQEQAGNGNLEKWAKDYAAEHSKDYEYDPEHTESDDQEPESDDEYGKQVRQIATCNSFDDFQRNEDASAHT